MPELVSFSKVAPYLKNPLVLVGFFLLLLFLAFSGLKKANLLAPLSQKQSFTVIKWGSVSAVVLMLVVFGYVFLRNRGAADTHGPIIQQTGSCGSNIFGDHNSSDLNCAEAPADKK